VTNPWTRDVGGGAPPPPPPPPGPPGEEGSVESTTNVGNAMTQDAETTGVQLEVNWDTAFGAITVVPYYNNREAISLKNDVEVYLAGQAEVEYTTQHRENSTEQKGVDMRIVSPEDFMFKWILGGTWYDSANANFTDDYEYDTNDQSNWRTQKNKAVYANITYPITDTFRGTAGYRRSWDKTQNVETPPKVGNGISGMEYSNPDYKLGLEYDLDENVMLYADYATSYRVNAMAINSAAGVENSRDVPPEELKAYSLGAKSRFFDNRLQLNASIFFYDYQNKRFTGTTDGRFNRLPTWDNTLRILRESDYTGYDPDGDWHDGVDINNDGDYNDTNLPPDSDLLLPGETSDLYGADIIATADPWTQQFGAFESLGVDLSMDWVITSKDRLNLQISYLDSTWTDCTVNFYWDWIWPSEGTSYNGKRATYSAEWSANASYQHIFELGSFGRLVPKVDMQYKSDYTLDFQDAWDPYNYQEPYTIYNASLQFTSASGMWSLNAYVKNITEYAAKTFWQTIMNNPRLGITDPKTYGAVLSVKF
jgi:outer membrane receptor protein involved in Fe transport